MGGGERELKKKSVVERMTLLHLRPLVWMTRGLKNLREGKSATILTVCKLGKAGRENLKVKKSLSTMQMQFSKKN